MPQVMFVNQTRKHDFILFLINAICLGIFYMGAEHSARLFILHLVKSELEAGRGRPRDDHKCMRVSECGEVIG